MATTTITVTHGRAADYTGNSGMTGRNVANRVGNLMAKIASGTAPVTSMTVSQANATATVTLSNVAGGVAASGSYALSGVGGTAASGTVTLAGGAGDVTIVTDGTSVGPVAFNTSDAQTALDCITALNANGTFAAKATASDGGSGVVLITWDTKGTVGNSKTLTASRTAGTATASGATLAGGAQGAVTVAINGTSVGPVDTTNLSDTDAATAVAAAIEANTTLGPLLVAVGSTTNVSLTWGTKGTAGNAVTLGAGTSATGTATRSGATLSSGVDCMSVTVGGVQVKLGSEGATDTDTATAMASALNADATVGGLVTATSALEVVTLTAIAAGPVGNLGLSATATSGTATASGTTLSGGTATTYTFGV